MKLDPVTLEIMATKVAAVADEMGYTLQRTGRTLYVKETADFGTALATRNGKFFAYPGAIGVSGFVDLDCRPTIEAVGGLDEGDVVITNHAYRSKGLSTHTPDFHVIKPVYVDGELVCYVWSFLHSSDVGGRVPSSISPSNTEVFQEGLLLPPTKLVRRGVPVDDIFGVIGANSRTPDENVGEDNVSVVLPFLTVAVTFGVSVEKATSVLKVAKAWWKLPHRFSGDESAIVGGIESTQRSRGALLPVEGETSVTSTRRRVAVVRAPVPAFSKLCGSVTPVTFATKARPAGQPSSAPAAAVATEPPTWDSVGSPAWPAKRDAVPPRLAQAMTSVWAPATPPF